MKITTNSICDDKLVELVSIGLSRVNLLVAISEIETTAVTIYDRFCASNSSKEFTLSSFSKTEEYYIFMSNAVFIDIFARARLPYVKDERALDKALFILDNYIKRLSTVTKVQQFNASQIFRSVINQLTFVKGHTNQDNWATISGGTSSAITPNDHLDAARYVAEYPNKDIPTSESRLCSNCNLCNTDGLIAYDNFDCDGLVSLSISYNGICFGFNVDPVLLGLNLPIDECDIKVFKNFLGRGCKELKKDAYDIFNALHEAHNTEGEANEPEDSD